MKADLYTKLILTVIAISLALIVIRDIHFVPEAKAAEDRGDQVVKVQIVSIDESPNLPWELLPVKLDR